MQVSELPLVLREVTLAQLPEATNKLLQVASVVKVWIFNGDMGAGKTTLIKELCKRLGVIDSMSSPTFSIVNEYWTNDENKIFHFDFYRIKKEEEAIDIGVEDYFYSGSYCFIEWPERIPSLLPDQYASITLETTDSNHRTLSLTVHGREEKRI